MLKKHLEVSRSLLDARDHGWSAPQYASDGVFESSSDALRQSISRLSDAAKKSEEEQEDFLKQLHSAGSSAAEGEQHPGTTLTAGEIADLNLIGAWFARTQPTPPAEQFGDVVQRPCST